MMSSEKFCAGCATPLVMQEAAGQLRPVCPSCGRVVYYDPKIAATSIVERSGKILMVRRAVATGYGLWSLPGGYVDRGEVVENAATPRGRRLPSHQEPPRKVLANPVRLKPPMTSVERSSLT